MLRHRHPTVNLQEWQIVPKAERVAAFLSNTILDTFSGPVWQNVINRLRK